MVLAPIGFGDFHGYKNGNRKAVYGLDRGSYGVWGLVMLSGLVPNIYSGTFALATSRFLYHTEYLLLSTDKIK